MIDHATFTSPPGPLRPLLGAAMLLASACGGPAQPPADAGATTAASVAEAMDAAPEPAPTPTAAGTAAARQSTDRVARGLQQISDGLSRLDQAAADPVDFETLMTILPEIDGWERSHHRGEERNAPVEYSTAQARYQRGDQHVNVELVDTALSQLLIAPYAMFLAAGFEERTSEGYRRAVTVQGSPAFEDWRDTSGRGEVIVVVNGRFVLKATGTNVPDIAPVRQLLGRLDVAALSELR
jgi:hypothetical protein